MDNAAQDFHSRTFSNKLWSFSEGARMVLVKKVTKTLSSEFLFSRKCDVLTKKEAYETAKRIADESFIAVRDHFPNGPDGNGSSAYEFYFREAGKRTGEVLTGLKPGIKVEEEVTAVGRPVKPVHTPSRMLLLKRVTKTLSEEFFFSRKCDVLTKKEVYETAKRIEEESFIAASDHFPNEPDGDWSSAYEFYILEAGKRTREVLVGLRPGFKVEEEVTAIGRPVKPAETVFDISGGTRSFIEAEDARELFGRLIEHGNSYRKICLSNRSFGIGAAQVAAPILMSIKGHLTEVNLSDFVAGRPEDEALEVMKIFASALEGCVLRYLNLSDNALGEKGVRAFEALLKSQNSLEELYLMNDGISEEAAKAVCELIPSTDKLKILHFHNNVTGDEGAIAISELLKRSSMLEDFRCSSTRVGSEGGIELAKALGTCTHLKRIDLRDNIFGVDAGITLSKTLKKLVHVTEIYVSYLNLEDEGAISIANALKDFVPSLQVLDIGGNDITTKAARALADCVATKKSLRKLILSENELKDQGAVLISKALEDGRTQLEELDLSYNMISRVGARCLAHVVSSKLEFKLLNINGNAISDAGIDEVREILKNGKNSEDVLGPLDENDVEEEGEEGEAESNVEEDEGELESVCFPFCSTILLFAVVELFQVDKAVKCALHALLDCSLFL